jgi:hypothetical protein
MEGLMAYAYRQADRLRSHFVPTLTIYGVMQITGNKILQGCRQCVIDIQM